MALTHTQINKLTPSEKCTPNKPDKYSHADGLQLLVRTTGTKTWYSSFRWKGKQDGTTLGKYPTLTLQEAIKRNLEVKRMVSQGIHPKEKKKADKAEQNNTNIFDSVAEAYYQYKKPTIELAYHSRIYSQYKRDIKKSLGNCDIKDIEPHQILTMAKAIEARGATGMAHIAIGQVKQIFDYAVLNGHAKYNPAIGLQKGLRPHTVKNHARIKAQKLPQLFKDIEEYNGHLIIKLGFWFMAYVFLRTKEMRFLEWQDIDFRNEVINMPAEKMKKKREHTVPLAPQVIEILLQIKDMHLSNQYVFFNVQYQQPYSENAWTNALKNMGWQNEMTGHGFRGVASTTLHELGYPKDIIETQLAHTVGNAVTRAYNHAEYVQKRIDLMNDWANHVDKYINGELDNITHVNFKNANQEHG